MPHRKFVDHRDRHSEMLQIDLRARPDSLYFASLPKIAHRYLLNSLRQAFLLVPSRPTQADCLNCSFESLLQLFAQRAISHFNEGRLRTLAMHQAYCPSASTVLVDSYLIAVSGRCSAARFGASSR